MCTEDLWDLVGIKNLDLGNAFAFFVQVDIKECTTYFKESFYSKNIFSPNFTPGVQAEFQYNSPYADPGSWVS